jgi:hypothetical protein
MESDRSLRRVTPILFKFKNSRCSNLEIVKAMNIEYSILKFEGLKQNQSKKQNSSNQWVSIINQNEQSIKLLLF